LPDRYVDSSDKRKMMRRPVAIYINPWTNRWDFKNLRAPEKPKSIERARMRDTED